MNVKDKRSIESSYPGILQIYDQQKDKSKKINRTTDITMTLSLGTQQKPRVVVAAQRRE